MNDEDVDIVFVFNECDEFLIDENDLSELVIFNDEDFLTRDVIIGGVEFEIEDDE